VTEPTTTNIGYTIPNTGDLPNTWGGPLNTNFSTLDALQGGSYTQAVSSGTYTISTANAFNRRINLTGTLSGNVTIYIPQKGNTYLFHDQTVRNGYSITVSTNSSGQRTQNLPSRISHLFTDGANVYLASEPLLGEERVFHGPVAPPLWQFPTGQALSRTTYADLFQATTVQPTGTSSNGSQTISGVTFPAPGYTGIPAGWFISGPGIAAGTTITGTTSSTITISQNAGSGAGAGTFVISPWGIGDGSTTFNVPDRRGRAVHAADNMGGTAANRLTSASMGSTAVQGVAGGNELLQTHNHGITDGGHTHGNTLSNPSHTHTSYISDPGHNHTVNDPGHSHSISGQGGGVLIYQSTSSGFNLNFVSGNVSIVGLGTNTSGTGIYLSPVLTGITHTNVSATQNTSITNVSQTTGITINNNGSGSSQNVPPTNVTNVIIYCGQ